MTEINSPVLLDMKQNDFSLLREKLTPPPQRAAYSDRTAWLMAALSEMAYQPFEKHDDDALLLLAKELAETTGDPETIKNKLLEVGNLLNAGDVQIEKYMQAALDAAGFTLIGTFFSPGFTLRKVLSTDWKDIDRIRATLADTQGFVVARTVDVSDDPMAVLVFRGTTNIQDWITNANAVLNQGQDTDIQMHPGFKQAYQSVENQVHALLEQVQGLPLYITGHSLGGALAICATHHLSKQKLAACYTFGGPRVGSQSFADQFQTPIYRVVNGFDPVPMIPPSGTFGFYVRKLLGWIPFAGKFLAGLLANYPYAHAGDQRYLSDAKTSDGQGIDWAHLKVQRNVGLLKKITNIDGQFTWFGLKNVISYHNMTTYRKKLRFLAMRNNPLHYEEQRANEWMQAREEEVEAVEQAEREKREREETEPET